MVFFHDDGVYKAVSGRMADDGIPGPQDCWQALGRAHDIDLALCSAAAARRLPGNPAGCVPQPFREAGLAELFGMLESCQRLVTF